MLAWWTNKTTPSSFAASGLEERLAGSDRRVIGRVGRRTWPIRSSPRCDDFNQPLRTRAPTVTPPTTPVLPLLRKVCPDSPRRVVAQDHSIGLHLSAPRVQYHLDFKRSLGREKLSASLPSPAAFPRRGSRSLHASGRNFRPVLVNLTLPPFLRHSSARHLWGAASRLITIVGRHRTGGVFE